MVRAVTAVAVVVVMASSGGGTWCWETVIPFRLPRPPRLAWILSFGRKTRTACKRGGLVMQSGTQTVPVSKTRLWAGRIMSALPALFLLVDGAMKVVKPEPVVKATVELGYAETVILSLGVVLLTCTILYLIPQTAVLGAILLTGYLGGAVATHVRAGQGPFEILFPVVFGALLWGGLVLRDDRLSTLIPLRN